MLMLHFLGGNYQHLRSSSIYYYWGRSGGGGERVNIREDLVLT